MRAVALVLVLLVMVNGCTDECEFGTTWCSENAVWFCSGGPGELPNAVKSYDCPTTLKCEVCPPPCGPTPEGGARCIRTQDNITIEASGLLTIPRTTTGAGCHPTAWSSGWQLGLPNTKYQELSYRAEFGNCMQSGSIFVSGTLENVTGFPTSPVTSKLGGAGGVPGEWTVSIYTENDLTNYTSWYSPQPPPPSDGTVSLTPNGSTFSLKVDGYVAISSLNPKWEPISFQISGPTGLDD